MKPSLGVLFLLVAVAIAAFGRPHSSASPATVTEGDFRKLEQAWLNAASTPDLPAQPKILSDDFMGSFFAPRILGKLDVVPPDGVSANHLEINGMTTVFQKHGEDWQVVAIPIAKATA